MKNSYYVILILFILITSCSTEESTIQNLNTISVKENSDKSLKTNEVFSNFQVIPLETTKKSLIGEVINIYGTENYFLVGNGKDIIIFNKEGSFIYNIKKTGKGPNEYFQITDFDVNGKLEEIAILDRTGKKIMFYSLNGKARGNIPIETWSLKLSYTSNNDILLYNGEETTENINKKFSVYSKKGKKKHFYDLNELKTKYLHINSKRNFVKSNQTYFFEAFNDTIYQINDGIPFPKYYIDYNGFNPPNSFFIKPYNDIRDFFQAFNSNSYANGIHELLTNSKTFIFKYYRNGKQFITVFKNDKKKADAYTQLKDNYFFSNIKLPLNELTFYQVNNKIMFLLPQYFLEENRDHIKPKFRYLLRNRININNNPLLFIYELKK